MLTLTPLQIRDALDWTEREFPFKRYVTDGDRRSLEHVIRMLAPHVDAEGVPKLLDVGCGPMNNTAVFQRVGFECCSVDDLSDPWHLHDDNREKIARFAQTAGIRFHLQSPGDYSIPFPEDHFDVVALMAVIEHLHESPREILNAAGRHLRDDGILCITMPNSVNARKRLDVLRGRTNYPNADQFYRCVGPWRGHVREYTLGETVRLCRAAGYSVLSATACEGWAYDRLRGLRLRLFLAVTRFIPTLRSMLCVIVRKPAGWSPREPEADLSQTMPKSSAPSENPQAGRTA